MTTTALAAFDPDDFDREAHELVRWAGATLACPLTPSVLRTAVTATVTADEVFVSRTFTPKTRADLVRLNRNSTGVFNAVINPGRWREVA